MRTPTPSALAGRRHQPARRRGERGHRVDERRPLRPRPARPGGLGVEIADAVKVEGWRRSTPTPTPSTPGSSPSSRGGTWCSDLEQARTSCRSDYPTHRPRRPLTSPIDSGLPRPAVGPRGNVSGRARASPALTTGSRPVWRCSQDRQRHHHGAASACWRQGGIYLLVLAGRATTGGARSPRIDRRSTAADACTAITSPESAQALSPGRPLLCLRARSAAGPRLRWQGRLNRGPPTMEPGVPPACTPACLTWPVQ